MQQLILNIEESRYEVLLQFLNTLEYVKVVRVSPPHAQTSEAVSNYLPANQLMQLQKALQQQSKPLFQQISDPVDWQKQQRDETCILQ